MDALGSIDLSVLPPMIDVMINAVNSVFGSISDVIGAGVDLSAGSAGSIQDILGAGATTG